MKILVDTREQNPLEFSHSIITEVRMVKLNVGDYGVMFEDGHTPSVFFERKSLPDLFGTMGKGYVRFKREIIRVQETKSTLIIIIEGSLTKVLKGVSYSRMEGISIVRKLFTIWIRYGIGFVCCKDRDEMSRYITEFYYSMGKEYIRRAKNEPNSNRQALNGNRIDGIHGDVQRQPGSDS